jgi:hypothetical protein
MKEDKKDDNDAKKDPKNAEYHQLIKEKSKELEFLNLTGDKILKLPENEEKKK